MIPPEVPGAAPASRPAAWPEISGFLVGALAIAAIIVLRTGLDRWLGHQEPLLWFIVPVMVAARIGGRRAGIATAVVAGWLGTLLFIDPRGRFPLDDPRSVFWFGTFVAIGVGISIICGFMRDAMARSQHSMAAAQKAGHALEQKAEARREFESYGSQIVRLNLIATGVSNLDGVFQEANQALLDLLGFTPEELAAGRVRWGELTPPEHLPLDAGAIRECRERGASHPYEKEYLARNGSRIPVLQRIAMLDSMPDCVVLYVVDMTRQKRVEQALRENEGRLRLVLDTVADHAIYTVDVAGTITSWTAGAQRVTGYTAAEAVGASGSLLYPADENGAEQLHSHLAAAQAAGTFEEEGWRTRRDGTRFWANVVTALLPDVEGVSPEFVKITRDLTERRRASVLMKSLLDNVAEGILLLDEWGMILTFSQGAERMFGYREHQVRGRTLSSLLGETDRRAYDEAVQLSLESDTPGSLGVARAVAAERSDGSEFPAELVTGEFYLDGRRHFTVIVRDITERRKLEAQLRQSQKMEAVGRLAGGVAHDFNNLLTVINGYSQMIQLEPHVPGNILEMVLPIAAAGEQAAGLTRQLLAFSRRAVLDPRMLDLNLIVRDTERILRRVIGEDVKVAVVLASDWNVRVDAGQTAQVLMNLAVNARDAMPEGGSLTLQTANVTVDAPTAGQKADPPPGDYVLLTVRDTGHGMTAEVQAHLFEPFFTTKPLGEGTGLGLATVYGIVRQSGGHLEVRSEVGTGTTFSIYLPAVHAPADAAQGLEGTPPGGTETLLLVEDEDRVRTLASVALTKFGYAVVSVRSGAEALAILADPAVNVDMVITDVVMPGMSGPVMAAQAVALRPGLRCLFVSGYSDESVLRHGILNAEMDFMQKPYTPRSLARKVREVLDLAAP